MLIPGFSQSFLIGLNVRIIKTMSLTKDFDFAQPDGHPERSRRVLILAFINYLAKLNNIET